MGGMVPNNFDLAYNPLQNEGLFSFTKKYEVNYQSYCSYE